MPRKRKTAARKRPAPFFLLLGLTLFSGVLWTYRSQPKGARDPASAAARVQAAQMAASGGAFAEAVSECRRALKEDPDAPGAHRVLGWSLYRMKRFREARPALERAVAEKPDDAFASCFLGLTYAQAPQSADEERRARELLERSTQGYRGAEPWYGLGLLALRRQELPQAIEHFRKAVETDPGWESGHYKLAEAYRLAGDAKAAARAAAAFDRLKRSRAEYERLYGEMARDPSAANLLRLARLCLETGRLREALDHYRRLAEQAPSRAVYQGLARAATALGQNDLAAQARQAAGAARER